MSKEKVIMSDLDKEFDPTQWSTRITDPKELLAKHVEFGNKGESSSIIDTSSLCRK